MRFVTTAVGERHRLLARRLAESFRTWDWPELTVVSDIPIPGILRNVIAQDDHPTGRGLKTGFAHYVTPGEGALFFVDADCEAVGPFLGAPFPALGEVVGIPRKTFLSVPRTHLLCSALLGFHNHEEAVDLCIRWTQEHHKLRLPNDEIALLHCMRGRVVIPCDTVCMPLRNLRHDMVTTSARTHSWFDFDDVYRFAVAEAPQGAQMVECGLWKGESLAYLVREAETSGKRLQVVGYDHFLGNYYLGSPTPRGGNDAWLAFVRENVPQAEVIRSDSAEAAKRHADGSVFFVFLDADHTETGLEADLTAWLPKIQPGGILAGHDLDHPKHPGVRAALEKSQLDWKPFSRSSWLVRTAPSHH